VLDPTYTYRRAFAIHNSTLPSLVQSHSLGSQSLTATLDSRCPCFQTPQAIWHTLDFDMLLSLLHATVIAVTMHAHTMVKFFFFLYHSGYDTLLQPAPIRPHLRPCFQRPHAIWHTLDFDMLLSLLHATVIAVAIACTFNG